MDIHKEIEADDLDHWMFRTPAALLTQYNARGAKNVYSDMSITLVIIWRGNVLQVWSPSKGLWKLPSSGDNEPREGATTIDLCYGELLRLHNMRNGKGERISFDLESAQFMD